MHAVSISIVPSTSVALLLVRLLLLFCYCCCCSSSVLFSLPWEINSSLEKTFLVIPLTSITVKSSVLRCKDSDWNVIGESSACRICMVTRGIASSTGPQMDRRRVAIIKGVTGWGENRSSPCVLDDLLEWSGDRTRTSGAHLFAQNNQS